MKYSKEEYNQHAKATDERQEKTSRKEEAERAWADIVNEACQKPIMKDMPFCPDEPYPVPQMRPKRNLEYR